MAMTNSIYRIRDVVKIYPHGSVKANDRISLDIRPGEIYGIFGPNGAGKTTLVRQMAGLIKPTSGVLELDGVDITAKPEIIPRYISYFSQAPWILWSLKVWETVYFTGIFRGLSRRDAKRETDRLLCALRIDDIRDRLMERLSGGQSRLLGIAAALIGDNPILLLDEPTNELDPMNRLNVWRLLARLCHDNGVAMVLVTHNILEAEQVVDRVMIIDHGRAIAEGAPHELKARLGDSVRIELKLNPNPKWENLIFLDNLPGCEKTGDLKWRVSAPKHEVTKLFNAIMERTGPENIADFRLQTATLEDVYFHLGGTSGDFGSQRDGEA